ncbi:MAG: DNA polymerase III subunit delta [Muribaculaceae bacterium]|nr:DNA polymerase III subunit delta [Muribaculaceae bacterium]
MAKKESTSAKPTFRSILSDIRKGLFAPVYILMGEETYYIDKLVETLEDRVVPAKDDREFNSETFYGQDADLGKVIASCQAYPFMADRRIVLLKEAQSMQRAKQQLEVLASYVERPNPGCVFVMSFKGDTLNATSNLLKAANKSGDSIVFTSNKLRDYELLAPISEYCRNLKVGISGDAIQTLIDYIGADLTSLFGTIDRLMLFGAEQTGRITPEMIVENVRQVKEYSGFDLQAALARKDYTLCMRIAKSFKYNPAANPVAMIVGFLFGFFSKLLMIQMSGQTTPQGQMEVIGSKSQYAFRDYSEALRRFSPAQTVNAIHLLRELDVKSKGVGSFQDQHDLLLEFIFNVFAGNGPRYNK